jgi:hypothetical protein
MVGQMHHNRSNTDPPDHRIEHERTKTIGLLPKEGYISHPGTDNKRHLWRCGEGEKGYKVASIQNGVVGLDFQLIIGNFVRKNRPTQVIGFVVDLVGKCV